MKKQGGFSLVEGLLIIIIISVVGIGGWYVWSRNQEETRYENDDIILTVNDDEIKQTTVEEYSNSQQDKLNDTRRKNDINSMYQKLEEYYNSNGYYPTATFTSELLGNIVPDYLIDPDNKMVIQNEPSLSSSVPNNPYKENQRPGNGQYTYSAFMCDGNEAGVSKCQKYILYGWLAGESETYTKQSLN